MCHCISIYAYMHTIRHCIEIDLARVRDCGMYWPGSLAHIYAELYILGVSPARKNNGQFKGLVQNLIDDELSILQ